MNKIIKNGTYGSFSGNFQLFESESSKFRTEYDLNHKYCPKCGSEEYFTTLVGFILNMDKKEEYKDLNTCECSNCGDTHTGHERIGKKN
jgi:predicted nucleic-acid-binding Zn-ribbon protein